jgi:hypothetical protein
MHPDAKTNGLPTLTTGTPDDDASGEFSAEELLDGSQHLLDVCGRHLVKVAVIDVVTNSRPHLDLFAANDRIDVCLSKLLVERAQVVTGRNPDTHARGRAPHGCLQDGSDEARSRQVVASHKQMPGLVEEIIEYPRLHETVGSSQSMSARRRRPHDRLGFDRRPIRSNVHLRRPRRLSGHPPRPRLSSDHPRERQEAQKEDPRRPGVSVEGGLVDSS